MNKHKVKYHRNSDTKIQATENHIRTTAFERSVMNGGGGLKSILQRQPHPQLLTWYKHLVDCLVRMIIL